MASGRLSAEGGPHLGVCVTASNEWSDLPACQPLSNSATEQGLCPWAVFPRFGVLSTPRKWGKFFKEVGFKRQHFLLI